MKYALLFVAFFGLFGGAVATVWNFINPNEFTISLMILGLPIFIIAAAALEEQTNDR